MRFQIFLKTMIGLLLNDVPIPAENAGGRENTNMTVASDTAEQV